MPFQPLFVFAADLHLQPNAWVKHPTLSGDAYESFRQIVDYCIAAGQNLVLGGDIFDKKRPDPHSVRFFGQQCARMLEADHVVTFVQGDHDYHPHVPWPTVSGMAVPLVGMSQTAGGYNVHGIDWTPRDQLSEALVAVPEGTDFLITHQAWSELQGIGQVEGSVANILHANFLLTGDYHVSLQKRVTAEDGREILVISPGSTCMQSVDERYEKSFIVVGVENGEICFEREPLLTRMKFELTYNTEQELIEDLARGVMDGFANDERLPQLPESIRKPILRVTFNDEIPDAFDRIEAAASNRFHIFPNPQRIVDDVDVSFDEAPEGAFDTLLDACRRLATDEDHYNLAARLLRAEDPTVELETMFDDFRESL